MKQRARVLSFACLTIFLLLAGKPALGAGQWRESPWFGEYYETGPAPAWVFREGFDWGYAYGDPSGSSAWFFVPGFDFVWSGEEAWPWFFSTRTSNWFYVLPGSEDPTYFFDSSEGRWEVGPTEFATATSRSAMSFTPVAEIPEPFPLGDLYAIPRDLRIQDTGVESYGGLQVRNLKSIFNANIRVGQSVQIRAFAEGDFLPLGGSPAFLNFSRNGATFSMGLGPDDDTIRVAAWNGDYARLGELPPAETFDDGFAINLYEGSFRQPGDYAIRLGLAEDDVVVTPLPELSLRVNRAEPSVLEGDVVADTGFRPNPDGMGFENFGDIRDSDLTEGDIRLLLGDSAVWEEPGGGTVLKATARQISEPLLDNMTGGHCFGISIVASRLFEEIPLSDGAVGVDGVDPTAPEAIDLQKFQLRGPISVDMARQFTSSKLFIEILATGVDGPTAAFDEIRTAFEDGDTVPALALLDRDGGGGHAITPYAITDQGEGVFYIHVYDNNFPDNAELVVEIDTVADTWRFLNTGPAGGSPYPEFNGDATTENFNYLSWEMLADYEPEIQPGMVRVQASESNQLLVEAEDGRRIGYDFSTGEIVREFPGAEILPVFDVESSPNYLIPVGAEGTDLPPDLNDVLDEMLEVFAGPADGSGDDPVDFNLHLTGEVFVSELGGVSLEAGEIFDFLFHPSGRVFAADGEEVAISELGFEFAINDDPAETGYLFEIEDIEIPEGSSVLVRINDEFQAEVYELPAGGGFVPVPPENYDASRTVVGVGFD